MFKLISWLISLWDGYCFFLLMFRDIWWSALNEQVATCGESKYSVKGRQSLLGQERGNNILKWRQILINDGKTWCQKQIIAFSNFVILAPKLLRNVQSKTIQSWKLWYNLSVLHWLKWHFLLEYDVLLKVVAVEMLVKCWWKALYRLTQKQYYTSNWLALSVSAQVKCPELHASNTQLLWCCTKRQK